MMILYIFSKVHFIFYCYSKFTNFKNGKGVHDLVPPTLAVRDQKQFLRACAAQASGRVATDGAEFAIDRRTTRNFVNRLPERLLVDKVSIFLFWGTKTS